MAHPEQWATAFLLSTQIDSRRAKILKELSAAEPRLAGLKVSAAGSVLKVDGVELKHAQAVVDALKVVLQRVNDQFGAETAHEQQTWSDLKQKVDDRAAERDLVLKTLRL
jgi:hypothetical protein